jgi:hypothetical protein
VIKSLEDIYGPGTVPLPGKTTFYRSASRLPHARLVDIDTRMGLGGGHPATARVHRRDQIAVQRSTVRGENSRHTRRRPALDGSRLNDDKIARSAHDDRGFLTKATYDSSHCRTRWHSSIVRCC